MAGTANWPFLTASVTVLLALCYGLGNIALKHPDFYIEKLFVTVCAVVAAIECLYMVWVAGSSVTESTVIRLRLVELDKFDAVHVAGE